MNKNLIKQFIEEHAKTVKKFDELKISDAVKLMIETIDSGSKIFWCGTWIKCIASKSFICRINWRNV